MMAKLDGTPRLKISASMFEQIQQSLKHSNHAWFEQHFETGDHELDQAILHMASTIDTTEAGKKITYSTLYLPVHVWGEEPLLHYELPIIELTALIKTSLHTEGDIEITVLPELKSARAIMDMTPLEIRRLTEATVISYKEPDQLIDELSIDYSNDCYSTFSGHLVAGGIVVLIKSTKNEGVDIRWTREHAMFVQQLLTSHLSEQNGFAKGIEALIGQLHPAVEISSKFCSHNSVVIIYLLSKTTSFRVLEIKMGKNHTVNSSEYELILDGDHYGAIDIPDNYVGQFSKPLERIASSFGKVINFFPPLIH